MGVGWALDGLIDWLLGAVTAILDVLWTLLGSTVLQNPDVTVWDPVRAYGARSLAVVNIAYVLAFIAAGFLIMANGNFQDRHHIGDLAPRLVIGLVAANFALPLCGWLITVGNALTSALVGDSITNDDSIAQLRQIISRSTHNPANRNLLGVLVLVAAFLVGALVMGWIGRLCKLVVLVAVAPLALACHALPGVDTLAKAWWKSFAVTIGTVTVQALILHTGLAVFFDVKGNLQGFNLPGQFQTTFSLIVALVMLATATRVPKMISRYAAGPNGSRGIGSYLLRVVIVQQATRLLGSLFGVPVAARAAARRYPRRVAWRRALPAAPLRVRSWRQRVWAPTTEPAPVRALTAAPLALTAGGPSTRRTLVTMRRVDTQGRSDRPTPLEAMPRRAGVPLGLAAPSGTGWPTPSTQPTRSTRPAWAQAIPAALDAPARSRVPGSIPSQTGWPTVRRGGRPGGAPARRPAAPTAGTSAVTTGAAGTGWAGSPRIPFPPPAPTRRPLPDRLPRQPQPWRRPFPHEMNGGQTDE